MKLSLKPHHLKRYKDIALLFAKYGTTDLAQEFAGDLPEEQAELRAPRPGEPAPEELAKDLERLGPTFVKLGQLLSTRADLLPEPYLRALARLQDKVTPFPYADVEAIVASELGIRISKAFSVFEEKELAAASLGQVHRAALRDGRPVAVKVQRPDIRKQLVQDFEVLEEIAAFLDEHTEVGRRYRFGRILEELKNSILQELDYQREASNLSTLAENLKEFPHLLVPLPVPDYTTRSVLTIDYVSGTKITALSPIAQLDIDGAVLADELFRAYLKQVLIDGFFHADPHPGNILLTEDGRVALLDLGMTGRLNSAMQDNLLRLLVAISEGNGDEAVKIVLRISETATDFDEAQFTRKAVQFISEQKDQTLAHHDVGKALMEVARTAAATGVYVPSELTLLGKTLLQLECIGNLLDPGFNPNAAVRRNVADIMTTRMHRAITPGRLLGSVLEMKDFVGGLPERVNKVLDAVGNSELEVNVNTPDARHLLKGFEKIANRVTTGVLLAALIVGAALLMRVESPFRLFGYPGFAMVCFLVALVGSAWLVLGIIWGDYQDRHKRKG